MKRLPPLTALALCAGTVGLRAAVRHERPRPPSVLLCVIDALRPDHLGCYGYERPTSPRLDAFARDCVVFESAESVAPWTAPSLISLVTSLPPAAHGVLGFPNPGRLDEGAVTLAERLHAHGYRTAAFTEGGYAKGEFGLGQGFDVFPENPGDDASNESNLLSPSRLAANVDRALAWLEANRDEPSFLFFHTYEVHAPLRAPDEHVRFFAERADSRRPLIDRYDAEIRYTDGELARLWDALARQGLDERTVVAVVSDHGESLGERGFVGHGTQLHAEQLAIALLVRAPGVAPRRVSAAVGLLDVMPTVLELCGLPSCDLAGTSLVPHLDGAAPDHETFGEGLSLPGRERRLRSIRSGPWRCILDTETGRVRLFDLAHDPAETQDVAREHPRLAAELADALRGEHWPPARYTGRAPPLRPGTLGELRRLGYLPGR